jgi:hypothetical protein
MYLKNYLFNVETLVHLTVLFLSCSTVKTVILRGWSQSFPAHYPDLSHEPLICVESGFEFIESGYGSGPSISSESGSGYGSRVLMIKNEEKNELEVFSFFC